ncbi:MAG: SIS domain-containing protein [Candidatus Heimdallarchaeota archaeon]|nr:SIS domain-containing protein [Candidatus Heimdallarchaeota archaeon]
MDLFPKTFDKQEFLNFLSSSVSKIDKASEFGQELASDYDKLVFIGCGAPNRTARLINHFVDLKVGFTRMKSYLPAEFIHIDPQYIDAKTVIVFGSYSGTTRETVDAAKFCKEKDCLTVSITRLDDSPLSVEVDHKLNFGDTQLGDYPQFIITAALVSGFLSVKENKLWSLHHKIIESLHQLPQVLADTVEINEKAVYSFTKKYYQNNSMLIVGHGPIYNAAYALAFCSFMEMFKIHASPVIAADFFHGPFELLDDSVPVIVLIGEDETREEGLRVQSFCEKYLKSYLIVDSKDFKMAGISTELRGFFSPMILDAATRRFMDYYAALRQYDRTSRRYMGVVEY